MIKIMDHNRYQGFLLIALCSIILLVLALYNNNVGLRPITIDFLAPTKTIKKTSANEPKLTTKSSILSKSTIQRLPTKSSKMSTAKMAKALLILSANPRSGSTFLADILTPIDSAYFFEPLARFAYEIDQNNNPLHELSSESKLFRLQSLLRCAFEKESLLVMAKDSRSFIMQKPKEFTEDANAKTWRELVAFLDKSKQACLKTNLRVAKTIRLSLAEVLEGDLLSTMPELQIIVLLRDPRGVANSLDFSPNAWPNRFKDSKEICAKTKLNLEDFEKKAPKKRVMLVKYEDIVEQPELEILRITNFLNWENYTRAITESWMEHSRISKNDTEKSDFKHISYYSSFRTKAFKHDKWKQTINKELKQKLESDPNCQIVFRKLYSQP